jgi:N-acetylglucosaminyl-diphospho-decaprenol L-rhamnosyltransferase
VNESFAFHRPTATDSHPARLTVIIVNHESWPDALRLTASLAGEACFRSGDCQIVVVDNASRGPVPEAFLAPCPGLRLMARPHNDGFAAGVNAGWRVARSPWLLVLNPDVEVAEGFLGQVWARLGPYEADPAGPPGIVGFGLLNPDGSPQGSVGLYPSLARTIREQFIPRSRRKYQAGCRIRSGRVDWVTGACMLVNTAMIAALGGMDEDFFLYYEEVAFSRAARRLGWRSEYDASVTVIHRHPLQNRAISPKMRVITRHSKLLYFLKHLPRWQFLSLSAIVTIEAAIRGIWSRFWRRSEDVRAWQTIGEIARSLRNEAEPRGRDVLRLAESVARPARDLERTHLTTRAGVINAAGPSNENTPLPPPSWGRVGVGGRSLRNKLGGRLRARTTPEPGPPPQGGTGL